MGIPEIHGLQISHTVEAVGLNAGQRASTFKPQFPQIITPAEHISGDRCELTVGDKGDTTQFFTSLKRPLRDG